MARNGSAIAAIFASTASSPAGFFAAEPAGFDCFFSIWCAVIYFSLPSGRGAVPAHRHERPRTGGTEPAKHPLPEAAPVSAGRVVAARLPWILRNRPRGALGDAWRLPAEAYQAAAQCLPRTVGTLPGGSVSRGGSAPQ